MKSRDQPDPASDAALEEEAAAWVCEREEGFTPARARAFAAWRGSDPRCAAAIARVEQTLALLGEMPAVRAPLEARVGPVGPAARVFSRPRGAAWAFGLAAALAVGFFAWGWSARPASQVQHYATEGATPRRVTLRDGSLVDLNAGSVVDVRFTDGERRVTLQAGEAHFQVAPDKAHPFVVTAGNVAIRAVGTAFNVRLASAEVAVVVTEGKVRVQREPAPTVRGIVSPGPALSAEVGASERTVVATAPAATALAPQVERLTPEEIRALLTWQTPMATFIDAPLRDVVQQFNRRNVTQLVIADAELGSRKIGAVIALDQVEAFVRLLEQDGDIVAARRGDEIVLRRAR